jgi:hypothetical protein
LGVKVARERGSLGQFDVFVDDTLVASRGGNMLKKALGGGWPDPEEVIARIEELQRGR